WRAFGGQEFAGNAHQATKAEQIAVAQRTLAQQGPGAWPTCGKRAGLTKANGGADANAQPGGREDSTSRDEDRTEAGALAVDGTFGPATARALERWIGVSQDGSLSTADIKALQAKVGAEADGKIGAETTRELRAAMGLSSNGVWDFRTNCATVKALQQFLHARCAVDDDRPRARGAGSLARGAQQTVHDRHQLLGGEPPRLRRIRAAAQGGIEVEAVPEQQDRVRGRL